MPFPTVRRLSLTIGDRRIDLPQLAAIFPNLRELSIQAFVFTLNVFHPSPETLAMREAALAFQRRGGGWQSLDKISGTIGDLFLLGIACPVRCLHLRDYDKRMHDTFSDVISRARPSQLDLNLFCAPWFRTPIAERLLLYNSSEVEENGEDATTASGRVTHLVIRMSLSSADPASVSHVLVSAIYSQAGTFLDLKVAHLIGVGGTVLASVALGVPPHRARRALYEH